MPDDIDPVYGLSQDDREGFQQLIDQFLARRVNVSNRPVPRPTAIPQAPETYIARTPSGGIPAMQDEPSPFGTGTDTGDQDRPGFADCTIFQIAGHNPDVGTGTGSNVPMTRLISGLVRRVYNLTSAAVGGNQFIVVNRDKFGNWVVAGGGCSGGLIKFTFLTSVCVVGAAGTGGGGGITPPPGP